MLSRAWRVYFFVMIHLPHHLERELIEAFPNSEDREQFVVDTLEQALSELPTTEIESAYAPESVGGTLHLFTDGGSRGNPGDAAIGYIIEDATRGETLKEHGECIGTETNNVAEYKALIAGLKAALPFHPNRLICHMDSELIVKQLNGEYRVKMETLQPLFEQVKALALQFPDVIFRHIPRTDNFRADALVNRALDAKAPRSYQSRPAARTPAQRPFSW
jgi:ribonuclease HI